MKHRTVRFGPLAIYFFLPVRLKYRKILQELDERAILYGPKFSEIFDKCGFIIGLCLWRCKAFIDTILCCKEYWLFY
jgi:hypothetical protein